MYIIAGSTGTLGTAIVDALSKENELFLIGRDAVSYTHLTLPTICSV